MCLGDTTAGRVTSVFKPGADKPARGSYQSILTKKRPVAPPLSFEIRSLFINIYLLQCLRGRQKHCRMLPSKSPTPSPPPASTGGRPCVTRRRKSKKGPPTVVAAFRKDDLALQYASAVLKNDPAIVLAAVSQKGGALRYASAELKNDPAIVLAAVSQNWRAFQYASVDLKDDLALALAAVSQAGYALEYVSSRLQSDPTVVLAAVSQNAYALQFATPELKNDLSIVVAAVSKDVRALHLSSAALRNGGLVAHIQSSLEKFNTPNHVFVGTVLCALRPQLRPRHADGAAAVERPAGPLLQKLSSHGPHHAANFMRAIAEYAGVQMGPEIVRFKEAARSLRAAYMFLRL